MKRHIALTRSSGFTLVELLTVIAIIAILAGILIPVSSQVRIRAMEAKCIAQMRQLGNAMSIYVMEHNDRFPGEPKNNGYADTSRRWWYQLAQYVTPALVADEPKDSVQTASVQRAVADTGLFKCPTIMEEVQDLSVTYGIYLYNYRLKDPDGGAGALMTQIRKPTLLPVLVTAGPDTGTQFMWGNAPHPEATRYGWNGETNTSGPYPAFRDRAVFLFADFHVESRGVCNKEEWPWDQATMDWYFLLEGGAQGY